MRLQISVLHATSRNIAAADTQSNAKTIIAKRLLRMETEEHERSGIMSAASMLRSVGRLGGPSGRGLIMFRTSAIASTSAIIAGIFGAFAGGMHSAIELLSLY